MTNSWIIYVPVSNSSIICFLQLFLCCTFISDFRSRLVNKILLNFYKHVGISPFCILSPELCFLLITPVIQAWNRNKLTYICFLLILNRRQIYKYDYHHPLENVWVVLRLLVLISIWKKKKPSKYKLMKLLTTTLFLLSKITDVNYQWVFIEHLL